MLFNAVNLLWQKRFRGLLPVGQHATGDTGHTLLLRPDEFERRTYQVLQLSPEGDARELCAVLVETMYRFDAVSDGRLMVGMTDDDVYVFRDARKTRFMADRRVAYSDINLAPEPGWFACGFSDHLFSSHAVAFGDAGARLGWTKDVDRAIHRVGLSPDGRTVVLALAEGRVLALDNLRNTLWESSVDEPLAALAVPGSGRGAVVGTAHGSVAAFGPEGGLRWRSPVGPPTLAVATDCEGRWAVSVHSDEGTHLLVALGPGGAPLWEYELDAKPTGLSLSPGGRYFSVTTAAGVALCFEADFAAGGVTAPGVDLAPAEGGEAGAEATLRARLAEAPHDTALAERWLAARAAALAAHRAAAEAAEAAEDLPGALAALAAAAELAPWDPDLFAERRALRERALAALTAAAAAREAAYDLEGARALHLEAVALAPEEPALRAALADLRGRAAAELVAEGEHRRAEGDLAGALSLWRQALALAPGEALEESIRAAEVERCLTRGIELYEAQRLPEAVFQFKKALALDPSNDDAARYLGYSEGQSADSTIADRFARLE